MSQELSQHLLKSIPLLKGLLKENTFRNNIFTKSAINELTAGVFSPSSQYLGGPRICSVIQSWLRFICHVLIFSMCGEMWEFNCVFSLHQWVKLVHVSCISHRLSHQVNTKMWLKFLKKLVSGPGVKIILSPQASGMFRYHVDAALCWYENCSSSFQDVPLDSGLWPLYCHCYSKMFHFSTLV